MRTAVGVILRQRTLAQRIKALFARGEQGAIYTPWDMSTLYQDSAGTTPVTALEQPVGLMLDKSKGLVLGPELVTNGDFSNGSAGFDQYSGLVYDTFTVTGGELHCVSDGSSRCLGGQSAASAFPVVAGKFYKVVFTVRVVSGTCGSFRLNTSYHGATVDGGVPLLAASSAGVYTVSKYVCPTSTVSAHITFEANNGVAGDFYVDSISVRELYGNHASQATAAKRPTLSARVNLLTYSEDFSNAAWVATNVTTASSTSVLETTANGLHRVRYAYATTQLIAHTAHFDIEPGGRGWAQVELYSVGGGAVVGSAYFNVTTGVLGTVSAGSATITSLGAGRYRCSVSGVAPAGTTSLLVDAYCATADGVRFYAGDVTKGLVIRGAQLETGSTATRYQRINAATDYDSAGFMRYLKCDGVDDSMATAAIDFSATDKMTVCVGVRKLSDAAIGALCELGTAATVGGGSFGCLSAVSAAADYWGAFCPGAQNVDYLIASVAGFDAPCTSVVSMIMNAAAYPTSASGNTFRVNSADTTESYTPSGVWSGNFGNYPLYLFARAGTSLFFNGNFYGGIIRGAQSSASQIADMERYINQRTGAY